MVSDTPRKRLRGDRIESIEGAKSYRDKIRKPPGVFRLFREYYISCYANGCRSFYSRERLCYAREQARFPSPIPPNKDMDISWWHDTRHYIDINAKRMRLVLLLGRFEAKSKMGRSCDSQQYIPELDFYVLRRNVPKQ
jgi:hypothetical protein